MIKFLFRSTTLLENIAISVAVAGQIWLRCLPYRVTIQQKHDMVKVMQLMAICVITAISLGLVSLATLWWLKTRQNDKFINESKLWAWLSIGLTLIISMTVFTFRSYRTW